MNPYQWKEALQIFSFFFSGTVIVTGVVFFMMSAMIDT